MKLFHSWLIIILFAFPGGANFLHPVQAAKNSLPAPMPAAALPVVGLPESASMDWWANIQADLARSSLAGEVPPLSLHSLTTTPAWIAESDQIEAQFGYSVSSAGDVNGDGYADVIVGAHNYRNGQVDEGAAFVYYGSASGLPTVPSWKVEGDQEDAWLGYSVDSAGDVNNDGYDDVIIGAPHFDNGLVQLNKGLVLVVYGSATGLGAIQSWYKEGNQTGAQFGYSVSGAGDVNGDGYDDVIIGAIYYDNGEVDEGRAYVFHGSNTGLNENPAWSDESDQESAGFGWPVRSAGDVNGDGYDDVVVGAVFYDNGQMDEGRISVYHGSGSGLAETPAWTAESDQEDARMGYAASAGDVNGDGFSDLVVSAIFYSNPETREGKVYAYHGSAGGLADTPSWTDEGDQAWSYFGWSVSSAGDINNDGFADVIIGSVYYDSPETDEGRAFAYKGSSSGLEPAPSWIGESDQAGAWFGFSVGSAGDVNGDGYDDVIIGANNYDNGQHNEGRAYLYYGSAVPKAFDKTIPSSGAAGVSNNPTLFWTASDGATSYEYCIDTTDDSTCTTWTSTGTATKASLIGLTTDTTYYWHVRAVNSFGVTYAGGSETAYWSFSTSSTPDMISKFSPANGAASQPTSVTLDWNDVIDADYYEYCYDTTNDSDCTDWLSTGTTSSVTLSGLELSTTYYWHVRVTISLSTLYANGSETEYWSFSTGNMPGSISKFSPTNMATGLPANPTLDWGDSSGAEGYEYCYDTTNDNACTTWTSTGAATSASLNGLAPNTDYYWHVRASNSFGTTYTNGSETSFWKFTTGDVPDEITKTSPLDGATELLATLDLKWSGGSGATSYEYCYDTTDDNTCSNWTSAGIDTAVKLSGLTSNTTYYWQVRAYNTFGVTYASGAETAFSSFTISEQGYRIFMPRIGR